MLGALSAAPSINLFAEPSTDKGLLGLCIDRP